MNYFQTIVKIKLKLNKTLNNIKKYHKINQKHYLKDKPVERVTFLT